MSSIVDINSVQGMTFYVHDWSAAQRQDYCYKVVIGSSILQDFTNSGAHGPMTTAGGMPSMTTVHTLLKPLPLTA